MSKLKKPFQVPKGTFDILPDDQKYWEKVRKVVQHVAFGYGFEKIDTPIIEYSDLYGASVGEATDVVEKQMYSFKSKGGDMLCLRPEGTAGVARSYIENGMSNLPQPVKLYYIGPMFRYEQPQAGRYRQLHQAGLEVMGELDPIYDAEVINSLVIICRDLGLQNVNVEMNTIGCNKCRSDFRSQILRYYKPRSAKLCKDCKKRIKSNPLRLLDCKEEKCEQLKAHAPNFIDHLCEECHNHFKAVLEYLDETEVPYSLNPHLVRGFDYYTKTVFEIFLEDEHIHNEEGGDNPRTQRAEQSPYDDNPRTQRAEQSPYDGNEKTHRRSKLALGGGGRYDNLIKILGGKDTPAVGGGLGIDRIIGAMKQQGVKIPPLFKSDVFLVQLGALGKKKCLKLFEELRTAGIAVAEAFGKDSIKAQLRSADRSGAALSLILGQKEAIDGVIIIREMASGVQETVPLEKAIKIIKEKLKK